MRHTTPLALALLLLIGCDSPPPPTDGGGADAGALDAGMVQVCERDSDCDDGEFCNGPESCRPGEGDARGCVDGEPPCEAMCDEAGDECRLCTRAEGDEDGDGAFSIACGGDDCDDDDPLRSGSMIEVCDVFGVDEDCNLETLYNAAGSGAAGDRDGDGHVDSACANIVGDEERRGDDCDDRDGAVFAGAAERCNGIDDDCDGALDEDFDCVQSADVLGVNACGHEGTRRCSETCEWIDAEFLVPESIATCDYCDDSGMGIEQEVPFTRDVEIDLCLEGSPRGDAEAPTAIDCQWSGTSVSLASGAVGAPAVGGLVVEHQNLGYGPEEFQIEFGPRDTEATQIALGIAFAPTLPTLGAASTNGLSTDVEAFAVRTMSGGPDTSFVELVRVTASGEIVPFSVRGFLYSGAPQTLRLTVVPDDPATSMDETRVTTTAQCNGDSVCLLVSDGVETIECVNDPRNSTDIYVTLGGRETVPCGLTLTAGADLTTFVVAATSASAVVGSGRPAMMTAVARCR